MAGNPIGHPRTRKANQSNFIKTLELIINNNLGQIKVSIKAGFPRDTFSKDTKKCYEKYDTKSYEEILRLVRCETIWPLS